MAILKECVLRKHYKDGGLFPHMCPIEELLSLARQLGPICHSNMALRSLFGLPLWIFFWYEIESRININYSCQCLKMHFYRSQL